MTTAATSLTDKPTTGQQGQHAQNKTNFWEVSSSFLQCLHNINKLKVSIVETAKKLRGPAKLGLVCLDHVTYFQWLSHSGYVDAVLIPLPLKLKKHTAQSLRSPTASVWQ